MSHFIVMAALKAGEKLEDVMLPYHEYECTGIEQYTQFVEHTDEVQEEWLKLDEKEKSEYNNSISEYAKEYHGYETKVVGDSIVFGRKTNPNAKWDWYVIGGRWSNSIQKKDGTFCDMAIKNQIDVDGAIQRETEKRLALFEKYISIPNIEKLKSWPDVRAMFPEQIDKARDFYNKQDGLDAARSVLGGSPFGPDPVEYFKGGNKEEFMNPNDVFFAAIGTYAFLSTKTGWVSKGDMGWWGVSSNESNDWPKQFKTLFDQVPDDHTIIVVDCHI